MEEWIATPDPGQLSPLALAFVGDGVYSLLVREALAQDPARVRDLHAQAVTRVCCEAQARAAREALLPALTPEEAAVYQRGRNAHVNHVPKNAAVADYHAATGLEALFGYLYLRGETQRLRALFELCAATFPAQGAE